MRFIHTFNLLQDRMRSLQGKQNWQSSIRLVFLVFSRNVHSYWTGSVHTHFHLSLSPWTAVSLIIRPLLQSLKSVIYFYLK